MERNICHSGGGKYICRPRPFLTAVLISAMAFGGSLSHAAAQQNRPTTRLVVSVQSESDVGNDVNRGSLAYQARPIPGASVTLTDPDRTASTPVNGVTDARGWAGFTVETDSDFNITVSHRDYHTGHTSIHVGRSPQTVEVRLISNDIVIPPEPATMDIWVYEDTVISQEHPISGAQVVLNNRYERDKTVTVTTDAGGQATAKISPGTAFWDISVSRPGYIPKQTTVRTYATEKLYELDILMAKDPRGRLMVRVRNARGNAATGNNLANAVVKVVQLADGVIAGLLASSFTKLTEGDGTATFDLTNLGRYSVTVSREDFKPETQYVAYNKYGDQQDFTVNFDLYPMDDTGAGSGTSPDNNAGGLNLTVRVVDRTGRAVPGASVSVSDASGQPVDSGITGEDGSIEFINQRRIPFARLRAGLQVTASKQNYEKATAGISQSTAETSLSHTETLTLGGDPADLLAAERQEIARQLGAFFAEITRLQGRVAGLAANRRAVLSCYQELNRLEEAIAAVMAVPSEQEAKISRASMMCDRAREIIARTQQRAADVEQRASDMARDLEQQAAASSVCKSVEEAKRIQASYMKAGATLVEVEVMQRQETQAIQTELPSILDQLKQMQPATPPQATSNTCYENGQNAQRSLDQLVREGVDPRSEAERLRALITAFSAAHSAAMTPDNSARLQEYLGLLASLNAESLSAYNVRESANLEAANAALTSSKEELGRHQTALSCNVSPDTSALQRLDAAVESMEIEVLGRRYILEEANNCEARLVLKQAACDAARLAYGEAVAEGKTQDATELRQQMQAAGCDMSGLPALPAATSPGSGPGNPATTNPAPGGSSGSTLTGSLGLPPDPTYGLTPGASTTLPPSVGGSQPAAGQTGGQPSTGDATNLPPSVSGSQPGVSTALPPSVGGSQPGGSTGLPPSVSGSQPGGLTSLPPSVSGSQPASNQTGGQSSSGGATNLPPSLGGSQPGTSVSLPPSIGGSQPSGSQPGGQSSSGGTQQPGGTPVGAGGQGGIGLPLPPTGGASQPGATPAGGSGGTLSGSGALPPYVPNQCAPAGKRWPKYLFFSAVGPNEEHQAVTPTLQADIGAYADYIWGGDRPDRPRVTVQLNFDGSTAQMAYRKGNLLVMFVGTCKIGDTGGGRMDVMVTGAYTIAGSPRQYPFTVSTMEWH